MNENTGKEKDVKNMSSPHLEMYAPATPVKKRVISVPNVPYKRPQSSRNLEQKEKWAASNVSLKAKLAAANVAWRTEMAAAMMQAQLSTFTLKEQ